MLKLRIFMHALQNNLHIPMLIKELKHLNLNLRDKCLTSKGTLLGEHDVFKILI